MDSTKNRLAKYNKGNSTMGKAMKLQTALLGNVVLHKGNSTMGKALKLQTNLLPIVVLPKSSNTMGKAVKIQTALLGNVVLHKGNSTMGKAMKLQTNLLGKGLLPKRNNMTGKAMKLHTNSTVDKEKNGLGGRKIPWMITFGGNGLQEAAGTDGKAKVQQRVMGRMCTMVDFAR